MRIVVTGRNGQVGGALLRSLDGLGEVIALDRAQLDLTDADAIRTALRELQPSIVINAAAYTAVDAAESDEAMAFRINADAPRVIAEEAERLGAALIHYSTDYVFDGSKDGPWLEDDVPAPLSAYGRSKLAGEQAIAEVGGTHLILRCSWVYGLTGKNFLLTMLKLAETRDTLSIVDDQIARRPGAAPLPMQPRVSSATQVSRRSLLPIRASIICARVAIPAGTASRRRSLRTRR